MVAELLHIHSMWPLLILAWLLGCAGYRFQLKANETGRFIYADKNGEHRYCTICEMGQNDAINMRIQQSECIDQNFHVPMPDGSKEPICCGPLPTSDGLSWRTESGKPIQVKSTVYEAYYPRCSQDSVLNRDLQSARCGEDLRWNATIQGLRCLYGCGPFPIGSKWRLQNGSEAGNESLLGETYFSECSPGHKRSIVMYCGPESKWHTNYSTPCETNKCERWYCSLEILIGICVGVGGLVLVAIVILIVYALYRSRRNQPVSTEEPEDAPLKEFTFTVSNTPGEQQPETMGDLKGEFLQMTAAKQECASA